MKMDRLDNFLKEVKFFHVLIFTAIFFILTSIILRIQFEENDDVVMLLIASGKHFGTPDGHLVFINYLFGYPLSSLYRIFPNYEWYTLSFSIMHIFSGAVIINQIFKKDRSFFLKVGFIVLFLVFFSLIIVKFQFTTTAGIVAVAGISLIFENKSKQWGFIGGFVLFLSSLIRIESAILVLIISSPLFFEYLISFNKRIMILAVALIFVLGGKYLNRLFYQNKDWAEYYEYNKIRGQISDNPKTFKYLKEIPENKKKTDLLLFLSFMPDGKVINLEYLKQLRMDIDKSQFSEKVVSLNNFKGLIKLHKIRFILFLGFFVFLFFKNKDWISRFVLLTSFFLLFVAFFLLSINYWVKLRVVNTATLAFMLVLMELSLKKKDKSRTNYIFTFFFISFLSLFFLREAFYTSIGNKYTNIAYEKQWSFLKSQDGQTLLHLPSFSITGVNPFKVSQNWQSDKFVFLGWLTNFPQNFVASRNHLNLIRCDVSIFIHEDYEEKIIPLLQKSILNNYGKEVEVEKITPFSSYFFVSLKEINM